MNRVALQSGKPVGQASYPLAVRGVAVLAQVAAPASALGATGARLWALIFLAALNLLVLLLVPARSLPRWAQLLFLATQAVGAIVAQTLAPPALIGYVYLSIIIQAIVLLPLWLWIPIAVGAYAIWSGLLAIVTASFLVWLQGNLSLAFPATCAIIAAIIYARQQRRGEQVQQMLAQVQQRYDSLSVGLREMQQRVMLEERTRLAQTIMHEVEAALSRTEQNVAAAMVQAQTNLGRLQAAVAQTRDSAAQAVERLRGTIAALRGEQAEPPGPISLASVSASEEQVLAGRSSIVLTWVLPAVFVTLAVSLTLVQGRVALETLGALGLCSLLLLLAYVGTQFTRNPVLLQAGLVGQAIAVLAMTVMTHTLPLLLGLLLILWQLSLRLPLRQIALYLAGLPAAAALLVVRLSPWSISVDALLVGVVATVTVGGPLLLARRQLDRRKQAELQLALLSAEIELQTSEVRAIAVAAERARLAREVHDDLGSRLMLINLQLQLAEELAGEEPEAALEQLRGSREQLHAAWSGVLAVADAELPLTPGRLTSALSTLVEQAGAALLRCEGELDCLSAPVTATIYRSAQEGLTNARKHAGYARVEVDVIVLSGYVTVTVCNARPNGAPALHELGGGGFGLVGLRERAEALGGGIEAGPTPDGGWRLRVFLPGDGV